MKQKSKTTKNTNPFSDELMGFIKEGEKQKKRLFDIADEIVAYSSKDNFPHFYIQSSPGMGKSYTLKDKFNKNNKNVTVIGAGVTMPQFGIMLALIVKDLKKNDTHYIYFDDCESLLYKPDDLNMFKNLLRDEKCYSYMKNMSNLLNSTDDAGKRAIEHFTQKGGGFKVPTDNIVFVMSSNIKLPSTDEVRTARDSHLSAIADRFNVRDFTMPPTTQWGYITTMILNSPYLPKTVPMSIKVEACQFFYDNWVDLKRRTIRQVEQMIETYLKNPKSYKTKWEQEFKK
jgi:hypothetical protein